LKPVSCVTSTENSSNTSNPSVTETTEEELTGLDENEDDNIKIMWETTHGWLEKDFSQDFIQKIGFLKAIYAGDKETSIRITNKNLKIFSKETIQVLLNLLEISSKKISNESIKFPKNTKFISEFAELWLSLCIDPEVLNPLNIDIIEKIQNLLFQEIKNRINEGDEDLLQIKRLIDVYLQIEPSIKKVCEGFGVRKKNHKMGYFPTFQKFLERDSRVIKTMAYEVKLHRLIFIINPEQAWDYRQRINSSASHYDILDNYPLLSFVTTFESDKLLQSLYIQKRKVHVEPKEDLVQPNKEKPVQPKGYTFFVWLNFTPLTFFLDDSYPDVPPTSLNQACFKVKYFHPNLSQEFVNYKPIKGRVFYQRVAYNQYDCMTAIGFNDIDLFYDQDLKDAKPFPTFSIYYPKFEETDGSEEAFINEMKELMGIGQKKEPITKRDLYTIDGRKFTIYNYTYRQCEIQKENSHLCLQIEGKKPIFKYYEMEIRNLIHGDIFVCEKDGKIYYLIADRNHAFFPRHYRRNLQPVEAVEPEVVNK
jgi:hypothetical protein